MLNKNKHKFYFKLLNILIYSVFFIKKSNQKINKLWCIENIVMNKN